MQGIRRGGRGKYKEERQVGKEGDRTAENRGGREENDKSKDVRERENGDEENEIGGEEGIRIGFWNVAGLGNKDRSFWKKLEEWAVIVLTETWTEEKGWKRVLKMLSDGYV